MARSPVPRILPLACLWPVLGLLLSCNATSTQPVQKTQASSVDLRTKEVSQPTTDDGSPKLDATEPGTPGLPPITPPAASSTLASKPIEQPPRPVDGAQLRQEAQRYFDELVSRVPDNPDALEAKARFLLLVGQSVEARQYWQKAIELVPDYLYAQHGLGKVAMLEGDIAQAITCFEKSLVGIPDSHDLVNDLSEAYMRDGQVAKAIDLLKQATTRDPNSSATQVALGQAYLADQQFELARAAFEMALKLTPNLPRAQQGLGTALLRLGHRQEAQKLLELQKTNRSLGKNRSTEETYQDEITEIALRYQYAARIYQSVGDLDRAEFFWRRATILKPRSDAAWEPLLSFYRAQHRDADAIATAQEMCQSLPNNPSYHFTLGRLYAQNQQIDQANSEFETVVKLAPTSPEGFSALARLSIEQRRASDKIISWATKAVDLRGSGSDYELLAQAYAVNNQLELARQSLAKALELEPDNKNFQFAMQQLERALSPSSK